MRQRQQLFFALERRPNVQGTGSGLASFSFLFFSFQFRYLTRIKKISFATRIFFFFFSIQNLYLCEQKEGLLNSNSQDVSYISRLKVIIFPQNPVRTKNVISSKSESFILMQSSLLCFKFCAWNFETPSYFMKENLGIMLNSSPTFSIYLTN